MTRYILQRILISIPVLLGVVALTFALVRMIPGEPCTAMLGEKATPELCERFTREKGLDKPIAVQFAVYLGDAVRGDLGNSLRYNRPVTTLILERLPATIELGVVAIALASLVGITAGIISAVRRNSIIDVATMMVANIGVSMPVFWLALLLAYFFALVLKDTPFWLPPSGRLSAGVNSVPFYEVFGFGLPENGFLAGVYNFISNFYLFNSLITGQWNVLKDGLQHIILPSMALATIPTAIIARMTRSSTIEVLGLDYVRTARAKGVAERRVVLRHAFRNALLPIVTIIGLQLGGVFSGAVLTESVFNLAGVGRILYDAITARDYPIIQGFTLVISFGYVLANLLVDLSYAYLDPRIRLT
jgi:peptide/nickel transport system permease protein